MHEYDRLEKYLENSKLVKKIYLLDTIDSTNSFAKQIASEKECEGILVIANHQTAGRGRMGRSFFSPEDSGAYFSVLFRPKNTADEVLLITSAIAVAVCRAIDKTANVKTEIKWVNDIYLGDKKLCGILTEALSGRRNNEIEYVVVGVGINIKNDAFPPEIADIATSVSSHSDTKIDKEILIAEVIKEFEKIYEKAETRDFIKEYKARSCVIGKKVNAIRAGISREVFVKDIDENGALVVTNEKGETEHINSGEISIRFV